MFRRRWVRFAAAAAVSVALSLTPRSVGHAEQRIYLPFAFGPACGFEFVALGPTPGPLPTLAARGQHHLRPSTDVQVITRDERTGDVWTAGLEGVTRWSRDAATVTSYSSPDGLPWWQTYGVAIAPDGTVWAAGAYDDEESAVARLRSDGRWLSIASPVDVKHLAVDRAGGVWVGGESGVARLAPDCGWAFPLRGFPLAPEAAVVDLLAASNGDVWVATARFRGRIDAPLQPPGIAVLRSDGTWRAFGAADGLRTNEGTVADIAQAPDGRVWAILDPTANADPRAPYPALIDVLGTDGRWQPAPMFVAQLTGIASAPGDVVTWDAAGRPWFRLRDRILVPDDTRPGRWNEARPPLDELFGGQERANKWIAALAVDGDGVAWLGARIGGMVRRLPDGTWRTDQPVGPRFSRAVAVDGDGVWMDTLHRGADGVWRSLGEGFPPQATLVNDIALAPDGVWFGTNDGLVRRADDGTTTHFTVPRALGGHDILAVAAAADGSIWAAAGTETTGPLVTRHRPDDRWEPHSTATGLPSGRIRGLVAGGDGAVWVGMDVDNGRRVLAFKPDGTVEEIDLPGYLASDRILAMAGDPSGALWLLGPEHGLVRRAADITWDVMAGQPEIDLTPRREDDPPRTATLVIAPDGSAWIGGRDGEVRVRRPDGAWRSLMLFDTSPVRDIAFAADGRAWMTMADGGSPRVVEVAR